MSNCWHGSPPKDVWSQLCCVHYLMANKTGCSDSNRNEELKVESLSFFFVFILKLFDFRCLWKPGHAFSCTMSRSEEVQSYGSVSISQPLLLLRFTNTMTQSTTWTAQSLVVMLKIFLFHWMIWTNTYSVPYCLIRSYNPICITYSVSWVISLRFIISYLAKWCGWLLKALDSGGCRFVQFFWNVCLCAMCSEVDCKCLFSAC